MDKGLDIAERRCVLAIHVGAAYSAPKLARLSSEFLRGLHHETPIPQLERSLDQLARSLAFKLDWGAADTALTWSERRDRHLITLFDPDYPPSLAAISRPPLVLYVRGKLSALTLPQIAIVGARRASPHACETAFNIAKDLHAHGFCITSGLALGIDTAAHYGALADAGSTVAVFGCGIDRCYPRRNLKLAEEIVARGALVSEFALGSEPRPFHFPRRNRIISGLAYGTLVVEAARRSGSISTATHALEQGREVMAMPGSTRNPGASGCHELIKNGAALIESCEDVLAALPDFIAPKKGNKIGTNAPKTRPIACSDEERSVLDLCEFETVAFDELVMRTGLTPTQVSSILSALEVRGLIRSLPGNAYLNTVSQIDNGAKP